MRAGPHSLLLLLAKGERDKELLFHTIHSAAPFCGIDPSQRQRVDSKY
jgi:hypothetical protein